MKRMMILIVILVMTITGCSGSDLQDYKLASERTAAYDKGEMSINMTMDLEFNEEGATFQELRDMSYYETIEVSMDSRYDSSGDDFKMISNTYYNIGGFGFDLRTYIDGDQMLMELPIMEKFLEVENLQGQENANKTKEQEEIFQRLISEWNAVLMEEDIISGKKDYIMTEKGQIKTTTYDIHINPEQFEVLKGSLIEVLNDEGVMNSVVSNTNHFSDEPISSEEMLEGMTEALETIYLESFEGKAYVDFDQRLVKQVFVVNLSSDGQEKGDMTHMEIQYEINHTNLGIDQWIEIPTVDKEDVLKVEDLDNIEDYFPEGLF